MISFIFFKSILIEKSKSQLKIIFINKYFDLKSEWNSTIQFLKWLNNFFFSMKSIYNLTKRIKINFLSFLIKSSIDTVFLMKEYFKLLLYFIWINFIKLFSKESLIFLIKLINSGKIWPINRLKEYKSMIHLMKLLKWKVTYKNFVNKCINLEISKDKGKLLHI